MAEALLREQLLTKISEVSVCSAGLHALIDYPADPLAQELMLERGLDISTHRARQITKELAFNSDLILIMDVEQQRHIEHQFPGLRGRVHRIGALSDFDIPDPYKQPRIIFEHALKLIEQGLNEWRTLLWN